MAIYSLHHSSVGRSTHAPGTAGAHVGYITRAGSQAEVIAERMPLAALGRSGGQARAWLDEQEAGDRKNGRVIDKVMVAIPRELTPEQQAALVRGFAEEVAMGRAPWLAAIHRDHPENPHAHIVVRDKDPETGKRVAGLSEKGSTDRLREAWERHANLALERAGVEARIDRRSLKEQGVDREPTIHVGPTALAIESAGKVIDSQVKSDPRGREVRYPEIDRGTRAQHNAGIIQRNARRIWEQETARAKQALEKAKEAWNLDQRREAAARYAAMPLEALQRLYDGELAKIVEVVVHRAKKLKAVLLGQRRDLMQVKHQVEGQEPAKPRFAAFGAGARWEAEVAAWTAEKRRIARRDSQLEGRLKVVEEYTQSAHQDRFRLYPTKADRLAHQKLAATHPDLADAMTAAHGKQIEREAHQNDRERRQSLERAGKGRRGPERSREV